MDQLNSACAILRGGIVRQATEPVVIVFTGSSTTAGHNTVPAKRWINRMAANMTPNPVKTLTEATAAAPLPPGIHIVNAGAGGTTAGNYLDGMQAQIASLNPRMVVHTIGANDFQAQRDPVLVQAQIKASVDLLKAKIAGPCVHLLVHSFERYDFTPTTYKWSDYRDGMKNLARATPSYIAFTDASGPFYAIGIPSTDPFGLMQGDCVHLNDQGHDFLSGLVRPVFNMIPPYVAPAPSKVTQESPAVEPAPLIITTTDTFSGPNTTTLTGRPTDALRGGASIAWQSYFGDAFKINNGRLERNQPAGSFAGFPAPPLRQVALRVHSVSGTIFLVASRNAIYGPTDQVRALLQGTYFRIETMTAGTIAAVSPDLRYAPGDEIILRYDGERIETRVNGVLVHATTAAVPLGAYAGIAVSDNAFSVDDFALSELQV
ncbi:SGNH/GDSL hydrolase family protein [Arthrobacter sp. S13_S34]|nr:SGNH/GDSL hydrolase family protein [Arthrobacter sp. S13_S34]